ncbi:OLC1v1025586C1 [Oldenlandia corymbosa var. corymbosa]|uniref:OLC1v1025586C1 n=1 Tax=Oldenlandia corymbosa var. corymbosa TaxID=529605 RepID=A0AAV1C5A0_OLDCO|nr:OLC1v1025586C1 [Oldenlandia corymbosa var. corymbosa]
MKVSKSAPKINEKLKAKIPVNQGHWKQKPQANKEQESLNRQAAKASSSGLTLKKRRRSQSILRIKVPLIRHQAKDGLQERNWRQFLRIVRKGIKRILLEMYRSKGNIWKPLQNLVNSLLFTFHKLICLHDLQSSTNWIRSGSGKAQRG